MIYLSLVTKFGCGHVRFTNNILSTAQQVWLKRLGGAKPAVDETGNGIISAGRAKRIAPKDDRSGDRLVIMPGVLLVCTAHFI